MDKAEGRFHGVQNPTASTPYRQYSISVLCFSDAPDTQWRPTTHTRPRTYPAPSGGITLPSHRQRHLTRMRRRVGFYLQFLIKLGFDFYLLRFHIEAHRRKRL